MQLTIKQEIESPLLSRKEVKAEISFDKATPSNDDVAKAIAEKLKCDAGLVVVKHIYTKYGETLAGVEAYVYESKEALESIEPKKKKKEEKKPGEAPAEAAAPAAPAPAEKKEEPKAAEKPAEKPAAEKPAEEKKEEAK